MASPRKLTLRFTALAIAALGLPMIWFGGALAWAGGSIYYVVAGVLITLSAIDLFRVQPRGYVLFSAALVLTLAWAVYEVGVDFWPAGSRIWIVGLLWLWLCTPVIRRRLWGESPPRLFGLRSAQIGGLASALVLGLMTANFLSPPAIPAAKAVVADAANESDWTAYGANSAGTRFAPHSQIDRSNVTGLQRVWEYETGQPGRFSATPIQIEDTLYLCTAQNIMMALDADTGEERWRYDPGNETPPYGIIGNCRGVTYYQLPDRPKGEHCAERIYTATTDARMIAVDRRTGTPCAEFGEDGQISLLVGMGDVKQYYYFVTSPPTVASGGLVVGGWVMDNQEIEEPSGVVRSYDPVDGSLRWAWDLGREGETGLPAAGDHYTRGTPNVWSLMSADDELGLVFVPTGNATPDYFGGHRTEAMDRYSSSVVAIDAHTGLTRWRYQTTHHDIWDYDVPSQPTLVDLEVGGVLRKALIAPTKRGEMFVLDRATGEPLTEVVERPVPESDLANERTSPTQPFSTGMPSFAYPEIREQDLIGFTPFDQIACRKRFREIRYEGPMTPPSTQGTLLYPGPAGGQNWGSVAVDEQRRLMVVNNLNLPFIVEMVEQEVSVPGPDEGPRRGYGIGGPQRGTPYAAKVNMFASPFFIPCLKPPYGEIAVVDLDSQEIVWRRGTGPMEIGLPYSAGTVITAGGLIFMGGVMDGQFRAIDADNGKVLWEDKLRSGSDATPISYVSSATGQQYVLVTVPGEGRPRRDEDHEVPDEDAKPASPVGGKVIAYALPAG